MPPRRRPALEDPWKEMLPPTLAVNKWLHHNAPEVLALRQEKADVLAEAAGRRSSGKSKFQSRSDTRPEGGKHKPKLSAAAPATAAAAADKRGKRKRAKRDKKADAKAEAESEEEDAETADAEEAEGERVKAADEFLCDGSWAALNAVAKKRKLKGRAYRFYYTKGGCRSGDKCGFAHEP